MKNPSGLCQCGCGEETPLSPTSRRGYKRGEPLLYIKGHSSRKQGPDYIYEDRGYDTPCWVWQKSITSEGYGRIWNNDRSGHDHAHRIYYEALVGAIPTGHDLHHLCEQRPCVNPSHLEPLTRRDHMASDGRLPFGNKKAEAVHV